MTDQRYIVIFKTPEWFKAVGCDRATVRDKAEAIGFQAGGMPGLEAVVPIDEGDADDQVIKKIADVSGGYMDDGIFRPSAKFTAFTMGRKSLVEEFRTLIAAQASGTPKAEVASDEPKAETVSDKSKHVAEEPKAAASDETSGVKPKRARKKKMETSEMFERGLIKKGQAVYIRKEKRKDSKATVVDGKNVMFRGEKMTFNKWGEVFKPNALNIYWYALVSDGRSFDDLRNGVGKPDRAQRAGASKAGSNNQKMETRKEMFEMGVFAKDDILKVKGETRAKSVAVVVDEDNVLFHRKKMSFNTWVRNFKGTVSCYKYVELPDGRTLDDVRNGAEAPAISASDGESTESVRMVVSDMRSSDVLDSDDVAGSRDLEEFFGNWEDQHLYIEEMWREKWFIEAAKEMRPLTPLSEIRNIVDRLGDIKGKRVLTFNIEFVPYLVSKGAKVTFTPCQHCPVAENVVSSETVGLKADYIEMEDEMAKTAKKYAKKFDYVVGNPPYQENSNVGFSIWPDFVHLGFNVLKKSGKLAMIHPPRWRGIGRGRSSNMTNVSKLLKDMDIEWLSMTSAQDCGRVFPGASIPFDIYVARKSNTPGFVTEVHGTDGNADNTCIKDMMLIPNFGLEEARRLLAAEGEERVDYRHSFSKFKADQPWMSKEKKGKFVHPCVWSISKKEELRGADGGKLTCHYANTQEPPVTKEIADFFDVPKVVFGIWNSSGIPYVDSKGKYGMTQHAAAIADDPAVLSFIAKAMDGYRFRSVMDAVRFSTEDWNYHFMMRLRKDFWKEFVNGDGDWIDADGNVIDRDGNPSSDQEKDQ